MITEGALCCGHLDKIGTLSKDRLAGHLINKYSILHGYREGLKERLSKNMGMIFLGDKISYAVDRVTVS